MNSPATQPGEAQPPDRAAIWWVPLLLLVFQLATVAQYGYFRDELYYLASADHLDFGYVEHPPFVVLVAWLVRRVLGDSLIAVRLLPILAGVATTALSALIAREMGGCRWAQRLAAIATAMAPMYIGLSAILSMNAFDLVFWAACWWAVARVIRTGDERWWLAFGLAAGIGLQNKASVLFVGFGVVLGLVLTRRMVSFARPWLWAGGAIAGIIFLPHVLWQFAHGWPTLEFIANATRLKNVSYPPWAFMREQLLQSGPVTALLWVTGLIFLLTTRAGRPWRLFAWAYLAITAVMLSTNAKPYYLAPAYTVLFAAGGLAAERWTSGRASWAVRVTIAVLMIAGGAVAAPFAKGVLPIETFVEYADALGMTPGTDEHQQLGRLPQFYADMHGWRELAGHVAEVYHALPPADQPKACIFGQDYGQAGAIDVFGPALGLPHAISGHNSYFLWGPRGCTGEVLIVIDDDRETLERLFQSVEQGGIHTCTDCMPYENNLPIMVARRLRMPMTALWPLVKKFI